jgi:hypothetical protein
LLPVHSKRLTYQTLQAIAADGRARNAAAHCKTEPGPPGVIVRALDDEKRIGVPLA